MAWTSPRTWVAGEAMSAGNMNTHLRDNMKSFGDRWKTFDVAWTAATTDPVLGDGTLHGVYTLAGKWCTVRIHLTMGSTTTYGSGSWRFAHPFTANVILAGAGGSLGKFALFDTSANARYFRHAFLGLIDRVIPVDDTSTGVASTVPFTWASGDSLAAQYSFEVA